MFKNRNLMKKMMAFILAAMLGLSALSSIIIAFAAENEESFEPISSSHIYISEEDDLEITTLEQDLETVTFEFDNAATFTVAPGDQRNLWLGWDDQYTPAIEKLAEKNNVNFDVVNFIFVTQFAQAGTMTMTTGKPYLYSLEKGVVTPIKSVYKDGVHTFATSTLDCLLASDGELAL